MNLFVIIGLAIVGLLLLTLLRIGYWYYCQYRFVAVVPGRLYRCQAMPPERMRRTVLKHGIRTVIDLRRPANAKEAIEAERRAVKDAGVAYINLPVNQTPTEAHIQAFLETVDGLEEGPLLVHCRDGRGRCVFYCAIHLIEYEGMTRDEARRKCRLISSQGTFSPTGEKGAYLLSYTPRR